MLTETATIEPGTHAGIVQAAARTTPVIEADPFAHETQRDRLRRRLLETTAELCAARGHRRIALCGRAGDLWPIARQPWQWHNVRVTTMLSDDAAPGSLRGVDVRCCDGAAAADDACDVSAVVVCSEEYEHLWFERAKGWSDSLVRATGNGQARPEVLRPYFCHPTWESDEPARRRLAQHWDISPHDAEWLIRNRSERHDATLPMLLPSRTELHLRRYEFASKYTSGKRVADIACGLGYGTRIVMSDGQAAGVVGIDLSDEAVAYARRRFARPGVTFQTADASRTGLADASADVITSFETIEHVPDPARLLREFVRVLAPGGTLVLSTPNDWGLTAHHVHSFTPESLRAAVEERFDIQGWWTQRATSERLQRGLPEGIAARRSIDDPAETLLLVARRRDMQPDDALARPAPLHAEPT